MVDEQDPRAEQAVDEDEDVLLRPLNADPDEDRDESVPAEGVDEDAFEDDAALATEDDATFAPLEPAAYTSSNGDSEDDPFAPLTPLPTPADDSSTAEEPVLESPAEQPQPTYLAWGAAPDDDDVEEDAPTETPPNLQPLQPRIEIAPPELPPPPPGPYRPALPEDLEAMVPLVPSEAGEAAAQAEAEEEAEPLLLRRHAIPINALVVVMTAVGTAICLGFLLIEPSPRWLLLAGAIAVIFGMDGVMRGTWGEPFASEGDTTPNLFLPALYILAGPMIVEHNIPGYWALPAGLLLGAGFGVVVVGELISVRTGAPEYPIARLVETVASYFVLFALISMTYIFEIHLSMALLSIGILTLMLGIEVLRQGEIDPMETLLLGLVSALIVVEARWLLHYMPIDGYLAGLTLTLVFFLTTGLLHAYVERQFDNALVLEYATIAAAGIALVAAARFTGLA